VRASRLVCAAAVFALAVPSTADATAKPACLSAMASRVVAPADAPRGGLLGAFGRALAAPLALPRGGTTILPRFRIVAYYGAPQNEALGALGIGRLPDAVRRLRRQARAYRRRGRPVFPALELIADLAKPFPFSTGLYVQRQTPATICRYLAAARRAHALLILDLQPGHADVLREVRLLRPWLEEPDVSLALDPEWKVPEWAVPGQVIGGIDASVVNAVARELARIVRAERLPHKLLIVHQFTPPMLARPERLRRYRGVELVRNVDGVGVRADKELAYNTLVRPRDRWFHGFKLFYEEDGVVMTPREVLALRPQPDVVIYE
jgi:hypothetical protein